MKERNEPPLHLENESMQPLNLECLASDLLLLQLQETHKKTRLSVLLAYPDLENILSQALFTELVALLELNDRPKFLSSLSNQSIVKYVKFSEAVSAFNTSEQINFIIAHPEIISSGEELRQALEIIGPGFYNQLLQQVRVEVINYGYELNVILPKLLPFTAMRFLERLRPRINDVVPSQDEINLILDNKIIPPVIKNFFTQMLNPQSTAELLGAQGLYQTPSDKSSAKACMLTTLGYR